MSCCCQIWGLYCLSCEYEIAVGSYLGRIWILLKPPRQPWFSPSKVLADMTMGQRFRKRGGWGGQSLSSAKLALQKYKALNKEAEAWHTKLPADSSQHTLALEVHVQHSLYNFLSLCCYIPSIVQWLAVDTQKDQSSATNNNLYTFIQHQSCIAQSKQHHQCPCMILLRSKLMVAHISMHAHSDPGWFTCYRVGHTQLLFGQQRFSERLCICCVSQRSRVHLSCCCTERVLWDEVSKWCKEYPYW